MEIVEQWHKAQVAFFEALKNFDEAGDNRRIHCMRYLLLTHMLMKSSINPFDSQETKPYSLLVTFLLAIIDVVKKTAK